MNHGKFVFTQLMSIVNRYEFNKCVDRYQGDYRARSFKCWQQFLCMSFGQLTQRDNLRSTVVCLNAHKQKLYHFGITKGVKKSTLADANEKRDWRIYADYARVLIKQCRQLMAGFNSTEIDLDNIVYALDATTIDLCLEVFWWAKFKKHKGAIKLHTLLDVKCEIPCFIHITDGTVHDVNVLDVLEFEANAFYVMDRGYVDWARLYKIHKAGAFFVIRAKKNLAFSRVYSRRVNKETGLRCDQIIKLRTPSAFDKYPEHLRRVKYYDKELQQQYVYLTNHFESEALQIAIIYLNRWKVELFFKWVKQHLKIKSFWGESPNAVKTQIWIAVCTFLLVAILKQQLKSSQTQFDVLQILGISVFDKTPVNELLTTYMSQSKLDTNDNQLNLF